MEGINKLIDLYLKNHKGDINLLGKLLIILLIFISIKLISSLINRIIDRTLKLDLNTNINNNRATTIVSTLKKVIKYVLVFIGLIMTLELLGINTASILATAGIGGLAIGFGAQSLVKDVITGFFILIEDQYSVGDYVQIRDMYGIVEELGLRVTKIRAFSGDLYIIPNGSIDLVTNSSRGDMRALVVVSISNEENIERATAVLTEALEVFKDNESIVDGPKVLGVSNIGEYNIDINIWAKTKPMEQWAVEREIRKVAIEALQKANIKRPYQKRQIIGGGKE
ncbi:MAG: mechanosensitive ion channel family protein [Tissierellaceae bacterium]|jgi:small-conductance mechanosensitive channel